VLLSVTSLWDIHLIVFVRASLRPRLSLVSSSTEATGFAHVLGNKGAAAAGLTIDGRTSIAFVTSHLAAQVLDACTVVSPPGQCKRNANCRAASFLLTRLPSRHSTSGCRSARKTTRRS
jgi:hypothetical protein